jgi:hypothetical protein
VTAHDRSHELAWEPPPRFLRLASLTLIFGGAAALVTSLVFQIDQILRHFPALLTTLVGLAGWLFVRRGGFHGAARFLVFGTWAVITANCATVGGTVTPAYIVYPITVLMAGWLVSVRAAQILATLTIVATALLLWAPLPQAPATPAMTGVIGIVVSVFSAFLVTALVDSFRHRLGEIGRAHV